MNSEKNETTPKLVFDGCLWQSDSLSAPEKPGIYCFYSVWHELGDDIPKFDNTNVLYIGKAINLRDRLKDHASKKIKDRETGKEKDNPDYLYDPNHPDRECFYSYAFCDGRSLERYEAMMIHKYRPLINTKNKETLGKHTPTELIVSGKFAPTLKNN